MNVSRINLARLKCVDPYKQELEHISSTAKGTYRKRLEEEKKDAEHSRLARERVRARIKVYIDEMEQELEQKRQEKQNNVDKKKNAVNRRRPVKNASPVVQQSPLKRRLKAPVSGNGYGSPGFQDPNPNQTTDLKLEPTSIGHKNNNKKNSTQGPNDGAIYFRCEYDYSGEMPGDLAFKKDQIVRALSKDQSQDGWWYGCNIVTGLYGTFPSNFVSPISEHVDASHIINSSGVNSPRGQHSTGPWSPTRTGSGSKFQRAGSNSSGHGTVHGKAPEHRSPQQSPSNPKFGLKCPRINSKIKSSKSLAPTNSSRIIGINNEKNEEQKEETQQAEGTLFRKSTHPHISKQGTDMTLESINSFRSSDKPKFPTRQSSYSSVASSVVDDDELEHRLEEAAKIMRQHFSGDGSDLDPNLVAGAATTIQKYLRSWVVQKEKREKVKAAKTIQSRIRIHVVNKKQHSAASVIQTRLRKWNSQKLFRNSELKHEAAKKIQAQFRAWDMQKEQNFNVEQSNAAVHIQKRVRAWNAKKELKEQKKAAIAIQGKIRTWHSQKRLVEYEKQNQDMAATKIQSQIRTWAVKKEVKSQASAASKIQDTFRRRHSDKLKAADIDDTHIIQAAAEIDGHFQKFGELTTSKSFLLQDSSLTGSTTTIDIGSSQITPESVLREYHSVTKEEAEALERAAIAIQVHLRHKFSNKSKPKPHQLTTSVEALRDFSQTFSSQVISTSISKIIASK